MKSGLLLLALSLFHFSTFAVDNSIYAGASNTHESAVSSSLLENSALFATSTPLHGGHYYDWARGRDGWGYCYEFANGNVLNGGANVPNYLCERENPSHYDWARGRDGYTYCYQFTPYGHVMNGGYAVSNNMCY